MSWKENVEKEKISLKKSEPSTGPQLAYEGATSYISIEAIALTGCKRSQFSKFYFEITFSKYSFTSV